MRCRHTRAVSILWRNKDSQKEWLLGDEFDVHNRMRGLIVVISGT